MDRPKSKGKAATSTLDTPLSTGEVTAKLAKQSREKKQTETISGSSRSESGDKKRKPVLVSRKDNLPDAAERTELPSDQKGSAATEVSKEGESPGKGILEKVTAHVHVNTDDNVDASAQFIKQLEGMGANIRKTLCLECTHLIVQNPSKSLQSRFRNMTQKAENVNQLENKIPSTKKQRKRPDPSQLPIPVSVLWLDACQKQQELVEESGYLVDMTNSNMIDMNSKRKKLMQPTKVTNADACDGRFSSSQPSLKGKDPFVSDSSKSVLSKNTASSAVVSSMALKRAKGAAFVPGGEIETPSKNADMTKARKRSLVDHEAVAKPDEENDLDRKIKTTANSGLNATNAASENSEDNDRSDITVDSATVKETNEKPTSSGKRKTENVIKPSPPTEENTPTGLTLSKKRKSPLSITNSVSPSEAKKAVRKTKRTIVMTNVEKETRDVVISTIRKLGVYKLGERVDTNTTHIVAGDTKRTMSIVKGIARGCWVVSPEWIYRSLENGQWQSEAPFELSEAFPAALQARNVVHGPTRDKTPSENAADDDHSGEGRVVNSQGFLSGVQVFVGDTEASREQVAELITYMGGIPVTSVSTADLGIGKGIAQRRWCKKEVVEERWLYDSITAFRRLPYDDYLITARYNEKGNEIDEESIGSPQF